VDKGDDVQQNLETWGVRRTVTIRGLAQGGSYLVGMQGRGLVSFRAARLWRKGWFDVKVRYFSKMGNWDFLSTGLVLPFR